MNRSYFTIEEITVSFLIILIFLCFKVSKSSIFLCQQNSGQFKKMYQQKMREQEKAYKRQEKQIKESKMGGKSKKQAVTT